MYVDGLLLLIIYVLAVTAAAFSLYALWSLEEIRKHYQRMYNQKTKTYNLPTVTKTSSRKKGHWG